MTIAHIAGLPLEESLLLPLVGGACTGVLLVRAWLTSRVRINRTSRHVSERCC
jgi:hypothetical protein